MLSAAWHLIVTSLVLFAVADIGFVIYRNRAAILAVWRHSPAAPAPGFFGLPALGLAGIAWDIFKGFLGSSTTIAATSTGAIGHVLQDVGSILSAMSNPFAALLIFSLIAGGLGTVQGYGMAKRKYQPAANALTDAIKKANARADAAIASAIAEANRRADEAIAKATKTAALPAPAKKRR